MVESPAGGMQGALRDKEQANGGGEGRKQLGKVRAIEWRVEGEAEVVVHRLRATFTARNCFHREGMQGISSMVKCVGCLSPRTPKCWGS
jgi:hypothetical protein